MNTENITRRIYEVQLLNNDLQRSEEDKMLADNVRISTSGSIEFDQIYTNSDDRRKVFYRGEYFLIEMPLEDYEELRKGEEEHRRFHEENGDE